MRFYYLNDFFFISPQHGKVNGKMQTIFQIALIQLKKYRRQKHTLLLREQQETRHNAIAHTKKTNPSIYMDLQQVKRLQIKWQSIMCTILFFFSTVKKPQHTYTRS